MKTMKEELDALDREMLLAFDKTPAEQADWAMRKLAWAMEKLRERTSTTSDAPRKAA